MNRILALASLAAFALAPLALPPLTPIERKAFDYTALEEAMAHLDAVVRSSRIALRSLAEGRTGTRAEPAADSAEAAPNC